MHLLFHTLILPSLLAIYALAIRKGMPPFRRCMADIAVIAGTCAVMAYAIFPPEQKIKLGRDLRGGVSLVYSVAMPEGADPDTKAEILRELDELRPPPGADPPAGR